MKHIFDSALFEEHALYHVKHGRGTLIVAVRRDLEETANNKRSGEDKYVARLYNERGPGNFSSSPVFEKILSIQEETYFVRVTVQFEHRFRVSSPPYNPLLATIERIIPRGKITGSVAKFGSEVVNCLCRLERGIGG